MTTIYPTKIQGRRLAAAVELPARPSSSIEPLTAARRCVCGQELEERWAYCPACAASTAPAGPRGPSKAEQIDAALREQQAAHAAAFGRHVTAEQRIIGAILAGGRAALAAVEDLQPEDFAHEGLGLALQAVRQIAGDRGYFAAWRISARAGELADLAARPGPPRLGVMRSTVPTTADLERWARTIAVAEALQVVRDLAAQVKAASAARLDEAQTRQAAEAGWEQQLAAEGRPACPGCGRRAAVIIDAGRLGRSYVDQRGNCRGCGSQWDAAPASDRLEGWE